MTRQLHDARHKRHLITDMSDLVWMARHLAKHGELEVSPSC